MVGVKWYLIVVLIGISLITKEIVIFSYNYEPFIEMTIFAY
jgi:hypothetical protein